MTPRRSNASQVLEQDQVSNALKSAPQDDEPYTDAERAADDEARKAAKRGETISTEELNKLLGL